MATNTDGFGTLFQGVSHGSNGAQTSWAVDFTLGNDHNVGTPSAPLKTMAEFNNRYNNVLVTTPATLQLVGDVTDAPLWLAGTRFSLGASLTVSGTRTTIGTATVTVVTPLGGATPLLPWQLTTTGINWTGVALNAQLRFSTGHVTFIVQVIDANNVIVGALAATGFATAPVTPTVSSTITVSSLSRALPPMLVQQGQTPPFVYQVSISDLSFDAAIFGNGVNEYLFNGSGSCEFYGCELKQSSGNTFRVDSNLVLRACLWPYIGNGSSSWRVGPDAYLGSYGLVTTGGGSAVFGLQHGSYNHSALVCNGVRLACNGSVTRMSLSRGTHIRNTAGPVLVTDGAVMYATGIVNGSTGNTGIGIDVTAGHFFFAGGSNKPVVTGASDTRVNGTARTYAQIPFVALQTDAAPNTVTTLTGNGSSIVQV